MRPLKGSGSEKRTPRRGSRGAVPERGVGEVGDCPRSEFKDQRTVDAGEGAGFDNG